VRLPSVGQSDCSVNCLAEEVRTGRKVSSARDELRDFPDDARLQVGTAIWAIQQGKTPPDFKPIAIVGKGVQEIRIRTEDAYRIFYIAKFEEAILRSPRLSKENTEDIPKRH